MRKTKKEGPRTARLRTASNTIEILEDISSKLNTDKKSLLDTLATSSFINNLADLVAQAQESKELAKKLEFSNLAEALYKANEILFNVWKKQGKLGDQENEEITKLETEAREKRAKLKRREALSQGKAHRKEREAEASSQEAEEEPQETITEEQLKEALENLGMMKKATEKAESQEKPKEKKAKAVKAEPTDNREAEAEINRKIESGEITAEEGERQKLALPF